MKRTIRFLSVVFLILMAGSACRKERIGLSWELQATGVDMPLQGIHFQDAQRGVAVGGDSWYFGLALHTEDGGESWTADSLSDKQLLHVHLTPEGEGIATGIDGHFFYRSAPTSTWSFYRWPEWKPIRSACFSGDSITLTAGGEAYQSGVIVRLTERFQLDTIHAFDFELSAICFSDPLTAHAVGYGVVLRSIDGGRSWAPQAVSGDFFRALDFPTAEIGYVVGSAGTILKTTDAGDHWEELRKGGSVLVGDRPFRAVDFRDATNGYIAGDKGLLWRTRDGGRRWEVIDNLPNINFRDLYLGEDEGWLVGEGGVIIHFTDAP